MRTPTHTPYRTLHALRGWRWAVRAGVIVLAVLAAGLLPQGQSVLFAQSDAVIIRTTNAAAEEYVRLKITTTTSGAGVPGTASASIQNAYLGIGLTDPSSALDVSGDFELSGIADLNGSIDADVTGVDVNSSGTTIFHNASGDWGVDISGANNYGFWWDQSTLDIIIGHPTDSINDRIYLRNYSQIDEALYVNGNVGIGSSNPASVLDIATGGVTLGRNAATFESGAGAPGMIYYDTDNNRFRAYRSGSWGTLDISGSGSCGWIDGGTDVYLATSTDSVGIGTSAPAGKLQITGGEVRIGDAGTVGYASGDGALYVEDAFEVDGMVYLGDSTSDYVNILHDENLLVFDAGQKRITSNDGYGNLSIMLGQDSNGLHVGDGGDNDGTSKLLFGGDNGTGYISLNAGPVQTDGVANIFNVGLTLDSGTQTLEIGNPNNATGLTTSGSTIADVNGDLYAATNLYHTGDTNTYLNFPSADEIRLGTNGSDRVTVLSTGLVGIGTTVPTEQLHVSGGNLYMEGNYITWDNQSPSQAKGVRLLSDAAGGVSVQLITSQTSGVPIFRVLSTGASERLRVEHDGALLTTNYLDVNGTGTSYFAGPVDIEGAGLYATEQGTAPGTPAAGKGVLYEMNDGKLYFKNDGGTVYDLTSGGGGCLWTDGGATTSLIATGDNVSIGDGSAYGDARFVIGGTNGNNDSTIVMAKRDGTTNPAFSILPWDSQVFLCSGVYYSNGTWVHNSDDGNNQLFNMDPGAGVTWYASSDSAPSWNVVSNQALWDHSAHWKSTVQSTRSGNSYFTGGNVGIGTTNPAQTLHLWTGGDVHLQFRRGDGVEGRLTYDNDTKGMEFRVGGTGSTRMFISDAGNVGIADVTPNRRFEISRDGTDPAIGNLDANIGMVLKSSGWTGFAIVGGNAEGSFIHLGDTDNAQIGKIDYFHSNNSMAFMTNGTGNRLVIDSGGNIDIGTDAATMRMPRKSTAGDPSGANGMIYYNSNTHKFRGYVNGAWADLGSGGGGLPSGTAGDTLRCTGGTTWVANNLLYNDGTNICIGTTTAGAGFTVRRGTILFEAADGGADTWFPYSNGEVYITGDIDGTGNGDIHLRAFSDGGGYVDRMIVEGDTGNVGIGTGTPAEMLHINGNVRGAATGGALRINTTSGYVDLGPQNTGWAHMTTDRPRFYFNVGLTANTGLIGSYDEDLQLQTSGTTRITALNASGNVGIGTTSPGSLLDVGGTSLTAQVQNLSTWGLNARTQGLIIMPEGTVSDDGAGNLTIPTTIIMNPLSGSWIRVQAGTYALGSWGALWAPIPPTGTRGTTVVPTVLAWSDLDRNYDGRDRVLLAQRRSGSSIFTRFGVPANVTTSGSCGWTDDGTTVRLTTSTDSVGVGNASPAEKLHVSGVVRGDDGFNVDGNLTISADGYHLDLIRGDNSLIHSVGGISFDWTAGTYDNADFHGLTSKNEAGTLGDELRINSYNDVITTIDSNNNDATSYFKVQNHSTGDGTDLFWVRSPDGYAYHAGNVGIGTTTPNEQLIVMDQAVFGGNTAAPGSEPVNVTGAGAGISLEDRGATTDRFVIYNNSGALRFWEGADHLAIAQNTGNVGIGTSAPAYKLDVRDGDLMLNHTVAAGYPEMLLDFSSVGAQVGRVASYVDGYAYLSANLYFDGTNYQRDNTAVDSTIMDIGTGTPAFRLRSAAAGANPATLTSLVSVERDGDAVVAGSVQVGNTSTNTADGTIRWTGSDFQGRVGGQWVSLTAGGGSGSYVQSGSYALNGISGSHDFDAPILVTINFPSPFASVPQVVCEGRWVSGADNTCGVYTTIRSVSATQCVVMVSIGYVVVPTDTNNYAIDWVATVNGQTERENVTIFGGNYTVVATDKIIVADNVDVGTKTVTFPTADATQLGRVIEVVNRDGNDTVTVQVTGGQQIISTWMDNKVASHSIGATGYASFTVVNDAGSYYWMLK